VKTVADVTMRFNVGDHVHVHALGKGIVREVRSGGRILIEIKGRSLLVHERELAPVEQRKRRSPSGPSEAQIAFPSRSHVPGSLDLHGMTADEAVSALETFLSDAILAGLPEVRVIHGRSGGKLRAAVHERLKRIRSVRAFRLDHANPGVTIVAL
jgi:DNA mismatch repair protein MutS2